MKLSVTINDATHEVSVKPGDLIAFERQYTVPWAEAESNPKIEHIAFLAWHAAHRDGIFTGDFDAFIEQVDELEDPDADEAPLDGSPAS